MATGCGQGRGDRGWGGVLRPVGVRRECGCADMGPRRERGARVGRTVGPPRRAPSTHGLDSTCSEELQCGYWEPLDRLSSVVRRGDELDGLHWGVSVGGTLDSTELCVVPSRPIAPAQLPEAGGH